MVLSMGGFANGRIPAKVVNGLHALFMEEVLALELIMILDTIFRH
jgi:hypothetical protein